MEIRQLEPFEIDEAITLIWEVFLQFELLPFPCFLIRRRFPICDRFEIRGTAEDFFSATDELPSESVLLSNLFAVSDTLLLHM